MAARRLQSDLVRHYTVVGLLIAAMIVFSGLLVALALTGTVPSGWLRRLSGTQLALGLIYFGLYGPLLLIFTRWAFAGLRGAEFRDRLRQSETTNPVLRWMLLGGVKAWSVLVAAVCIAVVAALILIPSTRADRFTLLAGLVLVVGCWILLIAVFAGEYAREWGRSDSLEFPNEKGEPLGIRDFIYLAVQVSTTFSSSDVTVRSPTARSLVTTHSVVAFAYNTVIVALFISLVLTVATG